MKIFKPCWEWYHFVSNKYHTILSILNFNSPKPYPIWWFISHCIFWIERNIFIEITSSFSQNKFQFLAFMGFQAGNIFGPCFLKIYLINIFKSKYKNFVTIELSDDVIKASVFVTLFGLMIYNYCKVTSWKLLQK